MNKLIRGKRYDTEAAKKIAEYDSEYTKSDFNWFREVLFRKRTGEYFLYCEGNGNSNYARQTPNGRTYGEKIIPYSIDDAKKWAESVLDADEYEEIFGKVFEGKIHTTLSLEAETFENLKQMAASAGTGMSEVIEKLIKQNLDK